VLHSVKSVLYRKLSNILKSVIRHFYLPLCNRRITKLESQYKDLINEPYNARFLSETISKLGKLWNEKLEHEGYERVDRGNGTKSLWQVQEEVHRIVKDTKYKINSTKTRSKKHKVFEESLKEMVIILDKWEI
jgi:hypothetical protein